MMRLQICLRHSFLSTHIGNSLIHRLFCIHYARVQLENLINRIKSHLISHITISVASSCRNSCIHVMIFQLHTKKPATKKKTLDNVHTEQINKIQGFSMRRRRTTNIINNTKKLRIHRCNE